MPTGFPGTTFDNEGICSYCANHDHGASNQAYEVLGEAKLKERLKKYPREGEYDCIIPVSGGKDSMYVLYYVVKKMGLKPLVVTYNAGFQTDIALSNIKNACSVLNVDYVIETAEMPMQKSLLNDILRISETIGSFVRTCCNCSSLIRAIPIRIAREKNIPVVLWGDSVRESVSLIKMQSKMKDIKYDEVRSKKGIIIRLVDKLAKLKEVHMNPVKMLKILPRMVRYHVVATRQLLKHGVPFKHAIFPNKGVPFSKSNPVFIHFFDYIDWDPVNDLHILKEEIKWDHPPGRPSRFDCTLGCFVNHRHIQVDGISSAGIIDCNLIREDMMTRDEALAKENKALESVDAECKEMLHSLGLDNYRMPKLHQQ
jgi:hypothetical protein